jgi:hypothetical protein
MRLSQIVTLLKLYVQLSQMSNRAELDERNHKRAFDKERYLDVAALHEQLEELVARTEGVDRDGLRDPNDAA